MIRIGKIANFLVVGKLNGTGLGLSICKRMLNEIECSIELVESEIDGPKKGSTF
jgi:nitrogen-specific signal transduction histidine kinase